MRKQVMTLFDDESGVSPVIGVILMVAITVILAAVIGTMVMDMTKNVGDATPTADITAADHNDDYIIDSDSNQGAYQLSHDNGQSISLDNVRLILATPDGTTFATFEVGAWTTSGAGSTLEVQLNGASISSGDKLSAGDSLTIVETADSSATVGGIHPNGEPADYTVSLVYTKGDQGSTLSESTVQLA